VTSGMRPAIFSSANGLTERVRLRVTRRMWRAPGDQRYAARDFFVCERADGAGAVARGAADAEGTCDQRYAGCDPFVCEPADGAGAVADGAAAEGTR